MSRERLLAAFLFCARLAAAGEPVHAPGTAPGEDPGKTGIKLILRSPCSFVYADGSPYDGAPVESFTCDFIRASIKDGPEAFEALPTPEAQKAFLTSVQKSARAAHKRYREDLNDLLIETDPVQLPEQTLDERLTALQNLDAKLTNGIVKIAKPFLWPPRVNESYIDGKAARWPAAWEPYIEAMDERKEELHREIEKAQQGLIAAAADTMRSNIEKNASGKNARDAVADGAAAPAALGVLYDGGGRKGDEAAAVAAADVRPAAPPAARPAARDDLAAVSDMTVEPPPIPETETERDRRNYFARGAEAGMKRLAQDATLGVWHTLGKTRTVGAPYDKASLIITQKGPACSVASQYEALRARGKGVDIRQLAKEGLDGGYYVDYALTSGSRGGGVTPENLDALLKLHGLKTTLVRDATIDQLDQAIQESGDALVSVNARRFWERESTPEELSHSVYVTGEEVAGTGESRRVVGFYINDTAFGEGARFVLLSDFNRAWLKRFVAIHDQAH